MADLCLELGTPLILDTSGTGLRHVTSGVFLLKPSIEELRICLGRDLPGEDEQWDAAHELIARGVASHVLVSLGAKGALLATDHKRQRFAAPDIGYGSGVGAGDALVAGVAVGLSRGWPLTRAVRMGVAAGAAMLLTPGTAVCTAADVQRLLSAVGEALEPGEIPT